MAMQTVIAPVIPSAQVVANAFIVQYYHILHHNPGHVYRFYQDSSVMSRPDSDGVMRSVTTMQGINEKILSFDYKEYKAEIETADAQNSYKDGVTVLVTGCLTSKDNLKRKFAQSFFLAPQENGFFVLNDVFRYVESRELVKNQSVNGVSDTKTVLLNQEPEPTHVPDPPTPDLQTTQVEEDQTVIEKAFDTSEQDRQSANEKETDIERPCYPNGDDIPVEVESASTTAQEDGPKKSYASIVKVAKGSPGSNKVYLPTSTTKVTSKKTEDSLPGSAASASVPESSAPASSTTLESSATNEEVEGYSIYIRNLPLSVTADELEVEFKKFGPIKEGGIQVRNKKLQGYCFGFVEFLSSSSLNSAIEASPITIGGRHAIIEIKRTNTRIGGSGSGSFTSGRGGFRTDSFRGHGSYGGGRSFVRNDYVNRTEFSGRGRGRAGRGGDGYWQGRGDGYQQGRGEGYHQGRGEGYHQGRGEGYQQGRGDGYQHVREVYRPRSGEGRGRGGRPIGPKENVVSA
ncbi:nuclear transport factor 2-like [Argentina anserina]|uniref:nuclear transport factor 2-like n=1 Tax=Argentina anserina TaxID=57926 RepID=UPI0021763252|nr:nuclear transport factor 2-like [Potentilla anserina]